jgi:hypothetical protein
LTRLQFSSASALSSTGTGSQVRDLRVETTGSGFGYTLSVQHGVTVRRVLSQNVNRTGTSSACRLVRATLRDSVCCSGPAGSSALQADGPGAATVRNATLRGAGFALRAGTVNISDSNYATTMVNNGDAQPGRR